MISIAEARAEGEKARASAFATDLDGTLTSGGAPLSAKVVEALGKARSAGHRLVLTTGRCLEEVDAIVPAGLFDATVAENGALLRVGWSTTSFAPAGWSATRAELLKRFPPGCEQVIVSAERGLGALAESCVEGTLAKVEYNKDRVMIQPRGSDKGSGLRHALARLSVMPSECACVGDGENDLPMFRVAGVKVALGNSVDALKKIADFVVAGEAGDGAVEALVELMKLNGLAGREGRFWGQR